MPEYKHPDYRFLYEWGKELDIEEWRVDSMIERVGGKKRKLRRQKKLPWLYKKGRRKYRVFIARWMDYWGLIIEAQYVRNWKPKKERYKPPKKEERIGGWAIVFPKRFFNREVVLYKWNEVAIHEDLLTKKMNRALEADSTPLIIDILAAVLDWAFVNDLELPSLGGRLNLKSDAGVTLQKFWEEHLRDEVSFPSYDRNNKRGDYVIYRKEWSWPEWKFFVEAAESFSKRERRKRIWTLKEQMLWYDEKEYLKCPWTLNQLNEFLMKDLKEMRDFISGWPDYMRKATYHDMKKGFRRFYRIGRHIVDRWRIKYCRREWKRDMHDEEEESKPNEIAMWIDDNRETFKDTRELWDAFVNSFIKRKYQQVYKSGAELGFKGFSLLGKTLFGEAWPWEWKEEDKIKLQFEFYNAELEARDPMHPLFNEKYRRYIKRGPEYTEYGDINPVTNIPPRVDDLAKWKKKYPRLDLRTFKDTDKLREEVDRLYAKLPEGHEPLVWNW